MQYGEQFELSALESYQRLRPQHKVESRMFSVWGEDAPHDWIGASPDGLLVPQPAAAEPSGAGFLDCYQHVTGMLGF